MIPYNSVIDYILNYNYVSNSIDISKTYASKRIFLMGPSGVGKTVFAKSYAKKNNIRYVDFDLYFGIVNDGWQKKDNTFLMILPQEFITEFIPSNAINLGKDIQIVYLCCSNPAVLGERLLLKQIAMNQPYMSNLEYQYTTRLNELEKCGYAIDYFDSFTNEFITKEEFLKRNAWINNS